MEFRISFKRLSTQVRAFSKFFYNVKTRATCWPWTSVTIVFQFPSIGSSWNIARCMKQCNHVIVGNTSPKHHWCTAICFLVIAETQTIGTHSLTRPVSDINLIVLTKNNFVSWLRITEDHWFCTVQCNTEQSLAIYSNTTPCYCIKSDCNGRKSLTVVASNTSVQNCRHELSFSFTPSRFVVNFQHFIFPSSVYKNSSIALQLFPVNFWIV